jgi:hypothetical protein
MFHSDQIQIQRYVAATVPVSSTGQNNLVLTTVTYGTTAILLCDIQPDRSKFITPIQGQTVNIYKIAFFDQYVDGLTGTRVLPDIREKDILTDLTSGTKYKITEVKKGKILVFLEVSMSTPI